MSVEFDVCNSSLDHDAWEELLADWADELAEDELFREPVFQQGVAFLLGTGSIRGASLELDPESDVLHVRLNALASRADWRRAFQVLRRALEQGGGELVREDGTAFSAAQLTDELADELAVADFAATVAMIHPNLQQGPATLPLDAFGLVLAPGDLPPSCAPQEVPALMARLATRVERLADAFPAQTFLLRGGLRLTTWAKIPTLVGKADLVSIEGLPKPVPLDRLAQLLGARAEPAGEDVLLLPELDPTRDQELLRALEAAGVDMDAWARDQGYEVPEGGYTGAGAAGGEEQGEVPALYAPLAGAIARVVMAASQGEDPRVVRRNLVRDGVDEQTADLSLHVVGRILGELFDEEGQPATRTSDELVALLVEDGLPETLAQLGVTAVSRLLGSDEDSDLEEDSDPEDGHHECGGGHDHSHGH